jgi:uncharacterized C2H2 Zn-finger protein
MTSHQFICQACGAVFASRQELDQHNQREHATAKNMRGIIAQEKVDGVNCPICGAQFTTADQMNRHARQEHQR